MKQTTKIPYTLETFPMDAQWIRHIQWAEGERVAISSVRETEIRTEENGSFRFALDDLSLMRFYSDGEWKPFYQEPKPWYEDIPEEGVMCICWSGITENRNITRIIKYNKDATDGFCFIGEYGSYVNAEPMPEEAIKLLNL